MILGNLGVETDHPPKMCAGLARGRGSPTTVASAETRSQFYYDAAVYAALAATSAGALGGDRRRRESSITKAKA